MTDLGGKTVYLSGPVTGLARADVERSFAGARMRYVSLGARYVHDPTAHVAVDASHKQAMWACLQELLSRDHAGRPAYDLLVSLPGWEASEGATLERQVAEAIGIPCVELGELGGGE